MPSEGERRGESRALDAEQRDDARHRVGAGRRDDEVARRCARFDDLRADACVAGTQIAGRDVGRVACDGARELLGLALVDGVVDVVGPLDVGTEPDITGHVERDVDAEPACDRHRIHEPFEARPAGDREVAALREPPARDRDRCEALDRRREGGTACARGEVERARRYAGVAGGDVEAIGCSRRATKRAAEHDVAAVIADLARDRSDERVAVDDRGRGGQERGLARHGRLTRANLCGVEAIELDTARARVRGDAIERRDLGVGARDDELAGRPRRDAVRGAVLEQQSAPGDARRRLEALRWVVDARVHDLAVARRRVLPERALGLEHCDASAGHRDLARDRESDDSATDDDRVVVHRISDASPVAPGS